LIGVGNWVLSKMKGWDIVLLRLERIITMMFLILNFLGLFPWDMLAYSCGLSCGTFRFTIV
jgi:hypothetical protein